MEPSEARKLHDAAEATLTSLEQRLALLRRGTADPAWVEQLQQIIDEIRAALGPSNRH